MADDGDAMRDQHSASLPSSDSGALLSAFVASLYSSKASLLCKPRPRDLDIDDLRLGAAELASTDAAPCAASNKQLSPAGIAISEILAKRRERFLNSGALVADSNWKDCNRILAETPWSVVMGREPDVVLCNTGKGAAETRGSGHPPLFAFHGTAFENVWSILSCGFVNAAQVNESLGRHGHARSLYGKGIYLSLEPGYAAGFVRPSAPLPQSLGRWRCLLLCEVAPGPRVTVGGASSVAVRPEGSGGVASNDAHDVPEGVVVVEDSDSVSVRCALFWHEPEVQTFGGVSVETVLAVLVALAAILYFMLAKSPSSSFARL
eukprot:gb/GFBE01050894.1/.p1 GENE.gb/GFBE01050894.1/~~gb/GFBE01050894.1/.p1  ORF type:complete len:320 (+),score=40.87 gb/GFBE01050894.1/:1-960(+)